MVKIRLNKINYIFNDFVKSMDFLEKNGNVYIINKNYNFIKLDKNTKLAGFIQQNKKEKTRIFYNNNLDCYWLY